MKHDSIFKITLLLFVAYFLFLLTKISNQIEKNEGIGRYQLDVNSPYVIDTKTGEVKYCNAKD